MHLWDTKERLPMSGGGLLLKLSALLLFAISLMLCLALLRGTRPASSDRHAKRHARATTVARSTSAPTASLTSAPSASASAMGTAGASSPPAGKAAAGTRQTVALLFAGSPKHRHKAGVNYSEAFERHVRDACDAREHVLSVQRRCPG